MRRILFFTLLLAPAFFQAQIDTINVLKPAAVQAVSSDERSPFAHTNVSEQEISDRDAAQDLPFLIRFAPSVVVTSDAGNGIGYTGMRLRGTDATRINVTINGVPLNDAESMGVWWVDLPDLGSSISDLQISRGVGTSTNGPSAFGGSVAINTLGKVAKPQIQAKLGYGSFNSRRMSGLWNTGILENGISFDGRISQITSDGYMNRATSNLFSLYGSLVKRWETGKVSITATRGEERTYQSWYGVPEIAADPDADSTDIANWAVNSWEYTSGYQYTENDTERVNDLIANRRQHNYYSYENEVDDYTQGHQQIHLEQKLGNLDIGVALFQTLGEGYFEQEKLGESMYNYGLEPLSFDTTISIVDTLIVDTDTSYVFDTILTDTPADIVRRRWLDNTLRGGLVNVSTSIGGLDLDFGGMYSKYVGDHFGRVISINSEGFDFSDYPYYSSRGTKTDFSSYARLTWLGMNDKLRVQAEGQIRNVSYATDGLDSDRREFNINEDFSFFNPKFGFDFKPNNNSRFYSSIAIANREPSRSNFLDSDYLFSDSSSHIVSERLKDLEIGFSYAKTNFAFEIGAYHMSYEDQLVNTGTINDVGGIIHRNVDESYRQGIEMQAGFNLGRIITWQGNMTLSKNKIIDFYQTESTDETDIAYSPSVVGASILNIDIWDGGQRFSDNDVDLDIELATKYVGKQYLDNTSSDDRSLPAYIVHDVILRCGFLVNEKQISLSIFANNIFDHMYSANGWTYYYPDGEGGEISENFVYPQAGRNGFASLCLKF